MYLQRKRRHTAHPKRGVRTTRRQPSCMSMNPPPTSDRHRLQQVRTQLGSSCRSVAFSSSFPHSCPKKQVTAYMFHILALAHTCMLRHARKCALFGAHTLKPSFTKASSLCFTHRCKRTCPHRHMHSQHKHTHTHTHTHTHSVSLPEVTVWG